MRRREFITLLGGRGSTWPLLHARSRRRCPWLATSAATSPDEGEPRAAAFRRGLQEAGYVEGQNVAIEYRWADATN